LIVFVEGKKYSIQEPTSSTLKKYGLGLNDWKELLARQGYKCKICKRIPSSGIFRIDHFHAQNFKKMAPEKKRKYLRGILCFHCNRYIVPRGITAEKAQAAADYLFDFEKRLQESK
jgi:hypothetical protein